MSTNPITAEQVRAALLKRIDAYMAATGKSESSVGKDALNDDRFVARIREGGNFTVKTYQKAIDWLDAQKVSA